MRALLGFLTLLLGCTAEQTFVPIEWTPTKLGAFQEGIAPWREKHGAQLACAKVDRIQVQCEARGVPYIVMLSTRPPLDDNGARAGGIVYYDDHEVWLDSATPIMKVVAAHEGGHLLMPRAGRTRTKGHTATGVMRPDGTPFTWTDEVIELCRAEGACR